MAGTMIEVRSNGGTVPAYLSLPPSGTGPGVVVIQEWWGLVPHIRAVADRLAVHGFVALAPDLYRGKETFEPDEAQKLHMGLQTDQAARDMAGAVDHLLDMPDVHGESVGVIGFCMGGGLALHLASIKPEVSACVCFYGAPPGDSGWDATKVEAAVLIHQAEHDDNAGPGLERADRELRDAGANVTTHRYPGTSHAFFNDDRPGVYDADAADLAWHRTLEFLGETLQGGS